MLKRFFYINLLSFLFFPVILFSQNERTVVIQGKVTEGKTKLDGATVTVLKNGATLTKMITSSDGKFEFELDLDAEYMVVYTKKGYVTKKVSINTKNTPPDDAQFGYAFDYNVELFKEIEDLDVSILQQPIGKFMYNPEVGNFNYDKKYTESIQARLDQLLKDLEIKQKRDADYNAAVETGDKAMASKKYDDAKKAYQNAISIKSNQQYPKDKIAEIDKTIAADKKMQDELKSKEAAYNAEIAKADELLKSKAYNNAKVSYQKAIGIKPDEKYAKDKIAEIDKLLADQKKQEEADKDKDAAYKAAIDKADKAFTAKDYNNSKISYQEALKIKSNESYPKTRIDAIDKLLAEQKQKEVDLAAKEAEYKSLIAKADGLLKSKDYNNAKTNYQSALNIKPTEQYPKSKIEEIDKLLAALAKDAEAKKKAEAEQAAKEAEYKSLIAKADGLLKSKDYNNAKTNYQSALNIKPKEQYPKSKMDEIDKLIAQMAKEEEAKKKAEEEYKSLIAKADGLFNTKDYSNAKTNYQLALNIKPNEQYPKAKIADIDKLLAELAKDTEAKKKMEAEHAAKEAEYKSLITKADGLLKSKAYNNAKTTYQSALNIKPTEQYPKSKMDEIDRLLAQDTEAKKKAETEQAAKEAEYNALIAKADGLLKSKAYNNAKTTYQSALNIKPTEQYPKSKMDEIDKLLAQDTEAKKKMDADQSAREAEYKSLITKADGLFLSKDYNNAKTTYQSALTIKPSEQYPKNKINEIDKLLADRVNQTELASKREDMMKANEEKYKAIIEAADGYYNSSDYTNARKKYQEALNSKASEQYPKEMLSKINNLLAEQAQKDREERRKQKEEDRLAKMQTINQTNQQYTEINQSAEKKVDYESMTKLEDEWRAKADSKRKFNKEDLSELENESNNINKELSTNASVKGKNNKEKQFTQQNDFVKGYEESANARREKIKEKLNNYALMEEAQIKQQLESQNTEKQKLQEETEGYNKSIETWNTNANNNQKAEKETLKQLSSTIETQTKEAFKVSAQKGQNSKEEKTKLLSNFEKQYKESENIAMQKVKTKFNLYEKELNELEKQDATLQAQNKSELKQKTETYTNDLLAWNGNADKNREANKTILINVSTAIYNKESTAYSSAFEKSKLLKEKAFSKTIDFNTSTSSETDKSLKLKEQFNSFAATEDERNKKHKESTLLAKQTLKDKEKSLNLSYAELEGKTKTNNSYSEFTTKDETYFSALASQYPEGVTEEVYEEVPMIITKRIVVKENKGNEYKKVVHQWGGEFYFKDQVPITEYIWSKETTLK